MTEFVEAEQLFNDGKVEEGLSNINMVIGQTDGTIDALMLRAKIYYKLQKWGDCLNDLNKILEIKPDNELAKNYKLMVMDIIRFWNKDSFNP